MRGAWHCHSLNMGKAAMALSLAQVHSISSEVGRWSGRSGSRKVRDRHNTPTPESSGNTSLASHGIYLRAPRQLPISSLAAAPRNSMADPPYALPRELYQLSSLPGNSFPSRDADCRSL